MRRIVLFSEVGNDRDRERKRCALEEVHGIVHAHWFDHHAGNVFLELDEAVDEVSLCQTIRELNIGLYPVRSSLKSDKGQLYRLSEREIERTFNVESAVSEIKERDFVEITGGRFHGLAGVVSEPPADKVSVKITLGDTSITVRANYEHVRKKV